MAAAAVIRRVAARTASTRSPTAVRIGAGPGTVGSSSTASVDEGTDARRRAAPARVRADASSSAVTPEAMRNRSATAGPTAPGCARRPTRRCCATPPRPAPCGTARSTRRGRRSSTDVDAGASAPTEPLEQRRRTPRGSRARPLRAPRRARGSATAGRRRTRRGRSRSTPSRRSSGTSRRRAASVSPSRVSQPIVSKDCARGSRPWRGTRPCVVRRPHRPWYDAGTRIEPAVSVARPIVGLARWRPRMPVRSTSRREARRAARRSAGCRSAALSPAMLYANSSVRAMPRSEAPPRSRSVTAGGRRGLGPRVVEEGRVARADRGSP